MVQVCPGSAAGAAGGAAGRAGWLREPRRDPVSEDKGTAPPGLLCAGRGSITNQSKPLQPIGELIGNFSWTSIWSYLHACNGAFRATFVLLHPA